MYGQFSTSNFFRYAKSDCPRVSSGTNWAYTKKALRAKKFTSGKLHNVQYWQSDSDGQIYFSMVQMDPSDKQVLRRRNDPWEADVSKRACPMDPSDNPMDI